MSAAAHRRARAERAASAVRVALGLSLGLSLGPLGGCGGAPATPTAAPDPEVQRYLPGVAGLVLSYRVDDGSGLPALATFRVLASDADAVTVQRNRLPPERLARTPDGLRYEDGSYFLRGPLEPGRRFLGRAGRTATVRAVGERVETAIGPLSPCVVVEETSGAPGDAIATTTLCADVGPVLVETTLTVGEATTSVRATLLGRVMPE